MAAPIPSTAPSRSWRERFGNPLEWPDVDKCLFAATVALVFIVFLYLPLGQYLLAHPEQAKDVDLAILAQLFRWFALGGGAVWSIVLLLALWLRRRPASGAVRALVHASLQIFSISNALLAYSFGIVTTPVWCAMLGTLVLALLLFERTAALAAVATSTLLFVAIIVAVSYQWIPYAPLVPGSPYAAGGRPSVMWMAGMSFICFGATGMMLVFFLYSISMWRRRDVELKSATERLERANQLIRRYVPAQLAEQILTGQRPARQIHERRKLTIVFSDIKDFTKTADQLEPEDLSHMLNEYLSEMSTIAEQHGGTVDKFIGDAIMIFFGAPVVSSDREHALGAVRMAIAMQRRMEELGQRWMRQGIPVPLRIRIGINTGVASVGDYGSEGRIAYTAIGNQVNLASRLESHGPPGRIVISHGTWALVHEEIPCVAKGDVEVKGIHYPVKIYEVTSPA